MLLNDVFNSTDGLLKQQFPQYQLREGQVQMAQLVQKSLESGVSAVVEGATGVGKGFAYLIPIIISGEKVIISTSNKNLQNQLDRKDLPTLKEVFKQDIQWCALKGKNNYFCHEHFQMNEDELRNELISSGRAKDLNEGTYMLQEIAKWAASDKTGDLEYIPFDLSNKARDLLACDNNTTHEKGSSEAKYCFASLARERAKEAQIILVNHTLLALDLSIRQKSEGKASILPSTKTVVIDEAHEFEKCAILAFSDDISILSFYHFANWTLVRKNVSREEIAHIAEAFRGVLRRYLPEKVGMYYKQMKVEKFEGLDVVITGINAILNKLEQKAQGADEKTEMKLKAIIKEGRNLQTRLGEMMKEDDNMLRWSEARESSKGDALIRLKSVPLDISNLLRTSLFAKRTVICTSATLAVGKSFDFFRAQVGMPKEGLELVVASPFDYKEQALVYITPGEAEGRIAEIEQLLSYSKGRAFILFTSYKDMRETYSRVQTDYPKFIQGEEGKTKGQVLEQFKNTPHAVLFATKSFWEGVDVQGEQLSLVVIWKMPFENPSDLVYSSKCKKIDEKAGKQVSFMKYAIPDACIKLKQGVGRLIRSSEDYGVMAILDPRLNYARYKSIIIDCLPPAYRTQQMDKVANFFKRIEYGK